MNKSSIFDRKLFKSSFKELYNNNKYNFPINDTLLSNIINKWKNKTYKMNKLIIFKEQMDNNNNLIFREYRNININIKNNKNPLNLEYIIWGNNESISRMRVF